MMTADRTYAQALADRAAELEADHTLAAGAISPVSRPLLRARARRALRKPTGGVGDAGLLPG